MKKKLKVVLFLLVAFTIIIISNPLRRSGQHIRDQLLSAAPLGSHISDVERLISEKGWEDVFINNRTGFFDQRIDTYGDNVGVKSIRASLGDYRNIPIPLETNVTVFWGFDKDSLLIDIWVWKTTDGL